MTKWISRIARNLGIRDTSLGHPCIVIVRKNNVRMSVYEYPIPPDEKGASSDETAYRIELESLLKFPDLWGPAANLYDYDLAAAVDLLTEAQQCITNLRREE